jgi:hypothetical protein
VKPANTLSQSKKRDSTMPGSAPFRLNRSGLLLALISAGFAGEAGAAAGKVDFVTSGVTVAGRDGQARPLARGAELASGDRVRTSADGRAQIRFNDGSYVSLQPNTDFAINDYKFEGKDDDRGFFGLVRGAMRTVTGAVGRVNRNSYRITTPTATVGIRGTGGVIQVQNDGSTLVIGTSGIWSLTNPAGSIDIPAGVSGLAPTEPNNPPKETTTQPQTSNPPPIEPKPDDFRQGEQVNQDGTAAVITSPKAPVLISGPGYSPAMAWLDPSFGGANLLGGDGGEGQPANTGDAVFNAAGQLTEFNTGFDVYKMLPGATHADFGTDGILAWGRWVGPVQTSAFACEGVCSVNYTENQGFHYVIGVPTAVMPVGGSASYSLLGATRPTYLDGSSAPGSFSGSISVDFRPTSTGSHTIVGNFNVAMPDGQGFSWTGRAGSTSNAFNMSSSVTGSGGACIQGCSSTVLGTFVGASAERIGISYDVVDFIQAGKSPIGAAAFKKN